MYIYICTCTHGTRRARRYKRGILNSHRLDISAGVFLLSVVDIEQITDVNIFIHADRFRGIRFFDLTSRRRVYRAGRVP